MDRRGKMRFIYEEVWRTSAAAIPLSLSLPLAAREHEHDAIDAYLWGLLPDNLAILDRWGKQFQVSARNAFALLSHVGEDCPGAVQLLPPDRVAAATSSTPSPVVWIDEEQVAQRLAALRRDHAAWRRQDDAGYFSLAGAQPKTALLYQGGRWGIPSGRAPTTHILKPSIGEYEGQAHNEHFCLALARACGLPTARSEVLHFGDELAISVERYDRRPSPTTSRGGLVGNLAGNLAGDLASELAAASRIIRIHQEDTCQALGRRPESKYQAEGGPAPEEIVMLLRTHSSAALQDVATFVDALLFNWVIGGTDAHAKNYSILLAARGQVRLAPLYDLASALPYPELPYRKLKLAMKMGGKYRLHEIGSREMRKLADDMGLPRDGLRDRALALATALPDHAADLARRCEEDGLKHPVLARLAAAIGERARNCVLALS